MSRLRLATAIVAAAAALTIAVGPVVAADQAVTIASFAYSPTPVTVTVGDSVTWTNNDGATHTATADGGSFDTGNIANGASKSVTFAAAGTFAYHCAIHSSMHGTVVVQAASGGGATPPATDVAGTTRRADKSGATAILILTAAGGWLIARRRFRRT